MNPAEQEQPMQIDVERGRWPRIVWSQDPHGQWYSGDLEIRPVIHKHGPLCWHVWLGDEQLDSRPLGYDSPSKARVAASQMAKVRQAAFGAEKIKPGDGPRVLLRRDFRDLGLMVRRLTYFIAKRHGLPSIIEDAAGLMEKLNLQGSPLK